MRDVTSGIRPIVLDAASRWESDLAIVNRTVIVVTAALTASGILLTGCGSPEEPVRRITNPRINPDVDPTGDLKNKSIYLVRSMAAVNERVAGKLSDAELIRLVEEVVKRDLRDPESAQFRGVNVRRIDAGRIVCGELNAKNAYGGFVGFKKFVGGVEDSMIESTESRYPGVNEAANAGIAKACH